MADAPKKGDAGVKADVYNVEAAELLANETQLLPISESSIPPGQVGQQLPVVPAPSTSDLSGSSKTRMNNGPSIRPPRDGSTSRQDDDESMTHSRPLPRDAFRLRQTHRSRGFSTSQTGSAASGGSVLSGEQSVSND